MLSPIKNCIKNSTIFKNYCEVLLRRNEIKRFTAQAHQYLNTHPDIETSVDAYIPDLKKYMFTFDEWYFQYDLSKADEPTKKSFISRSRAQKWYRRLVRPEVRLIFHSKPLFLKTFPDNIHRKYLNCDEKTTLAELKEILKCEAVIVKPQSGSLGQGVYKLTQENISKLNPEEFLNKCRQEHSLIEECIKGAEALQNFHPASLNTIRVMTAAKDNHTFVFDSFIRFGRGNSVIDNAHGGGIYCTIDVSDGTICSDAHDTEGNVFTTHPDSGLEFKGFKIPQWNKIAQECCRAHSKVNIPFVGWDVCVDDKGHVVFIEGNHAPDLDIIQGPMKRGRAADFEEICINYRKH